MPPHYTTGQIATIFGLSYNGARLMLVRGSITSFRVPGSKHRRVPRASLITYVSRLSRNEAELVLERLATLDDAVAVKAAGRKPRGGRKANETTPR